MSVSLPLPRRPRAPGLYRLGGRLPRAPQLPRKVRMMLRAREARELRQLGRAFPPALVRRRRMLRARAPRSRGGVRVWSSGIAGLATRAIRICGNIRATARLLGVCPGTLYHHRKADPAFAVHWEEALTDRYKELEELLLDQAIDGWTEEVWYQGKRAGTRHCRDYRLGIAMLKHRESCARRFAGERRAEAGEARTQRLFDVEMEAAAEAARPWTGDRSPPDVAPRHQLFLDLMERHRNRHPDEWDEDIHVESGFDFNDWRAWVARWEAERLPGAGDDGGGGNAVEGAPALEE